MDKSEADAAELLKDLTPKTKAARFAKAWPAIKKAIDEGFTLLEIYNKLHTGNALDVHYVTFTRMVKRKQAAEAADPATHTRASTTASAASVTASPSVDHTIHSNADQDTASQGEDKSNTVYSQAGSALEQARTTVAKTDYAKLARQAERDSKK